jgi:hypothetical protein
MDKDQELIREMDISLQKRPNKDEKYLNAKFFFRQGCTTAEIIAFGNALDRFADNYSAGEALPELI